MKPTCELRFVKRDVRLDVSGIKVDEKFILQQKWVTTFYTDTHDEIVDKEEWRDIEIVEEE